MDCIGCNIGACCICWFDGAAVDGEAWIFCAACIVCGGIGFDIYWGWGVINGWGVGDIKRGGGAINGWLETGWEEYGIELKEFICGEDIACTKWGLTRGYSYDKQQQHDPPPQYPNPPHLEAPAPAPHPQHLLLPCPQHPQQK